MFQAFMSIALPALVTITAALVYLHRAAMEEQGSHRPSPPRPEFRPYTSRGPASDNSVPSRRTGVSSESSRECVLCGDTTNRLQDYFCEDRCLCEDCARRMFSTNNQKCPSCRKIIQRDSKR